MIAVFSFKVYDEITAGIASNDYAVHFLISVKAWLFGNENCLLIPISSNA